MPNERLPAEPVISTVPATKGNEKANEMASAAPAPACRADNPEEAGGHGGHDRQPC